MLEYTYFTSNSTDETHTLVEGIIHKIIQQKITCDAEEAYQE